jgi:Lsr2
MAQKVVVQIEDDLTGGPADETVSFGFDGRDYEIDLSAKNSAAMRQKLEPFVSAARRSSHSPRQRRTSGSRAGSREESAEIRAWAAANGHDVSSRGRIAANVVAAYQAANGKAR